MWFFNNIPYHLPKARGTFVPGVMDVMHKYTKDGLFMRLYYPTDETIKIESNHKQWVPAIPDNDYIKGISKVLMIPEMFINLTWLKSGKIQIPALYGHKISNNDQFKLILFSHGLGALRSFYSAIGTELASRGYLVAVLEHRDESACHTYYFKSKEDANNNIKTAIEHKRMKFGEGHYEARKEQVYYRTNELCTALDFFIDLNNGSAPHNVMNDVPTDRKVHFSLSDLIGKIDLNNLIVGGHSFGAATAMMALGRRKELKMGIILDPWMYPIKAENLDKTITQPMLFINTQTFHIEVNVKSMSLFVNAENTTMYTILRSTHEIQTDSVFIAGYWLNWFMRKINPITALLLNNGLILSFLKQFSGHTVDIDDCETYLKDNKKHVAEGLTKPWA